MKYSILPGRLDNGVNEQMDLNLDMHAQNTHAIPAADLKANENPNVSVNTNANANVIVKKSKHCGTFQLRKLKKKRKKTKLQQQGKKQENKKKDVESPSPAYPKIRRSLRKSAIITRSALRLSSNAFICLFNLLITPLTACKSLFNFLLCLSTVFHIVLRCCFFLFSSAFLFISINLSRSPIYSICSISLPV